ncbi:hypothetical protein NH514_02505 [Pseudoalteromonas sp. ACER1]|jgi:hypothetical protein|uniref:Uncharacterized protein n=2 Tax=Pseudoalteromonas TaxID=53246 RepID=A0A0P7EGE9_9GAMM|nr:MULTISPECIES: hypothetical protein [Pseudoalteromonas]MED5512476.1 hypothetical protein [Pseudomonadota bacterium]KPM84196.1 hypothetical protein AOG27_07795 [Pseudoalteromonas lipolytica]MCF2848126.1 hypothetical protein [Pseudoalteromonas sp. PAST1]MCO7209605.1 hypothetical protein [Pseudoalteromonas sp. ACER1]TMP20475.1 hypothetical protein CWC02_05095 [Pseudoalteromonas sp. S2721]|tara:strand:+ start:3424 stop:3798 length:375 start_codon:yes stop_codon:yes gene_type:complete
MRVQLASLLMLLTLLGCSAQSQEPTPKLQHARLTEPQSELIAQGIARLMHSKPIAVADDAFMNTSVLVTDSMNVMDGQGNLIMGKQLSMPERFELLIKNQICFVRHLDSKATEPLPLVKCKPVD